MTTWIPAFVQDMEKYIKNKNVWMYGRWNNPPSALEGGVDLGASKGTPVYALGSGTIVGIGYFCHLGPFNNPTPSCPAGKTPGYGVVTIRGNVPGFGVNDLYYQHIDIASGLKLGQQVQRGTRLGSVGAYNETEIGANAQWGQPWGVNHPGPWYTDPRPLILALMNEGLPGTNPGSSNTQSTHIGSTNTTTSTGGNQLTTQTNTTTGGSSLLSLIGSNVSGFEQFMIAIFAGIIILVGLIILFLHTDTGKKTTKVAMEAAAV